MTDEKPVREEPLRRDLDHLRATWEESADAIEELSKIENGGEVSETVAGAAAQLRRCSSQLSSVVATPLELASQIGAEPPPPSPPAAAAKSAPAPAPAVPSGP